MRVTNYHEAGVKITSCLKEYIVTARNVKNMNDVMHVVPDVKVLSFDIECYTDNKGMSDARNDEFTMLGEFFKMIVHNDPKIIIGYNILGFDMKYIMYRYYSELANIPHAGRTLSSTLRDEIIHKSWKSAAYGIQDNVIINFTGRCCFDIYSYLKMEVPMQKYSLDYVSSEILGRNKLDLSYKDMFDYYRQGRVVEIADYCFVDSDLALELWYKLRLWAGALLCKPFMLLLNRANSLKSTSTSCIVAGNKRRYLTSYIFMPTQEIIFLTRRRILDIIFLTKGLLFLTLSQECLPTVL